MADKRSLGFFGFILGAVTLAVTLVAAVTVHAHIASRLTLEGIGQHIVAAPASTVTR